MAIRQFVALNGTNVVPVTKLCGWGVWKDDHTFDYTATKQIAREAFDLWGTEPLYQRLKIVGAGPYKAGQRSMLWEVGRKLFGADPLNYAQEIGDCFVKGTMVTMADGSTRPIEFIQPGDQVVSHKNRLRKVTRTIQKSFSGTLVTLRAKGYHRGVTATADHPFVQYPYNAPYRRYSDPIWSSVGSLKAADRILMPYGDAGSGDLKQTMLRDGRHVTLDERFGRLLGIYLAEGGVDGNAGRHNRITLSFGRHEELLVAESVALFESVFGAKATVNYPRTRPTVTVVRCADTAVASFIKSIVPGDIYHKSVPSFIFQSPKTVRLAVLRGWLDGDGCIQPNHLNGISASHDLITSMHRLALSCRLRPKSAIRKKAAHQRVAAGVVDLYGSSVDQVYATTGRKRRRLNDACGDGIRVKVRSVSHQDVVDVDVYCLEVEEDHSFIANGYAVHNCTSFGMKNAVEYVQFFPMANGQRLTWTMVFPPYFYGCSRILIGDNQLGRQDGSMGSWTAQAVLKFGTIPLKYEGVPAYSGRVATQWGNTPGPDQKWVDLGKQHIVKSAALVKTWEDVVAAVVNGYPITIASNIGYDMTPRQDGFNEYSTEWAHQMCIIGVDDDPGDPYAAILNNWGDVHGEIKDFKDGTIWPKGTLRVRKKNILKVLAEGESFAISALDGFPAQKVDRDQFDLW